MMNFADFRRSPSFLTFVVAISIFTDVLLYSIIIPVLPSFLRQQLHVKSENIQTLTSFLLSAYGGAVLLSALIVGMLTDRAQSKKTPFVFGLFVLLLATGLFFLSPVVGLTIFARILQGVSAAVVWTSGLAYLNQQLSQEMIGPAMGYVNAGSSVGELMGPSVGGFIYDRAGHQGLFAVATAVVVCDVMLRLLLVDDDPVEGPSGTETGRQPIGCDHEPLLSSPQDDPTKPNSNRSTQSNSAVGLLLTDSEFLISIIVMLTFATMRSGLESTVPIFTETTFGWQSTQSGLALLILVIPSVASPFFSPLVDKFGTRWPSSVSLVLSIVFFVALAFQPQQRTVAIVWFSVCIFGIGVAVFAGVTINLIVVSNVATKVGSNLSGNNPSKGDSSSGQAFAFMTLSSAGGFLLGPIIAGPVVSEFGWRMFCFIFATISLASALVSIGYALKKRQSHSGRHLA